MATAEENFMTWLRDAYAMEQHQAIESIEKQVTRLENYPQLRTWVQQHLEQSRQQADMLRQCIERRGGSISTVKELAAKVMGNIQAVTGMLASDEVVKNVITDYAFKQYEIACYRSLIAGAEQVGDHQTRQVCEQILRQEEDMAERIAPLIPQITQQYLQRDAAGQTAGR